jgi:hypothetical protein
MTLREEELMWKGATAQAVDHQLLTAEALV